MNLEATPDLCIWVTLLGAFVAALVYAEWRFRKECRALREGERKSHEAKSR